ncbi:metal-sensitive transcriptional regulator [Caldicellulosiruptor morganii]|uniref:Metal-sensitive transcriptional regulator n=1 Tax=Caldicellulosiruptor morganii TaxID=1387555 RepID=A0ABY7BP96_9FIRM|nr:metal-sensitive transcriptional regulator [Caldicellulosiruptor morganii]WAM34630.1 metal-sensitive transcriptional regulator [Caldicellulosiruptor morganii]
MPEKERKEEILSRLKNIKGHIEGIIKMVEEEKECEEIMLQIAAVKKAIEKVGYYIIESHATECLSGVANKDEVRKVLNIMMKFLG